MGNPNWEKKHRGNVDGIIDEVRLYNRALSSQQVRNRYNRTRGSHTNRPKPPVVVTNRELSAGPYLAFTSPSEALIRWETAKPMPTRLAYGMTPTLQNRINQQERKRSHEVILPGIEPGAIYHYSVGVEKDGQTQWLEPATGESDFNYSRPDISAIESPYAQDERMRKSSAAAEAMNWRCPPSSGAGRARASTTATRHFATEAM